MKTLYLTLHKKAFEVMVTGEKKEEFRKYTKWSESRLIDSRTHINKKYDVIKFVNGYGNDKPYFICEFKGFTQIYKNTATREYSNGLKVDDLKLGDYIIYCGEITEKGNLCG